MFGDNQGLSRERAGEALDRVKRLEPRVPHELFAANQASEEAPLQALAAGLVAKRLELLKAMSSGSTRMAVLWQPGVFGERTMRSMVEEMEVAGRALRVQLQFVEARRLGDFEQAFSTMRKARLGGLLVFQENPGLRGAGAFGLIAAGLVFVTQPQILRTRSSRETLRTPASVSGGLSRSALRLSAATVVAAERAEAGQNVGDRAAAADATEILSPFDTRRPFQLLPVTVTPARCGEPRGENRRALHEIHARIEADGAVGRTGRSAEER